MKRVSEGAVLPRDKRIKFALAGLRHDVENSGSLPIISLQADGIYRAKDITSFKWEKVDGILLGYRIEETALGIFKRFVWFVTPGYRLAEIQEKERQGITTAIFQAGLDQGAGEVEIFQPTEDSMLLAQEFMPIFLYEHQPGLLVPGSTKKALH